MGGADCDVIPNCILNTNEVFAPLLKVEERYQPDEITISPNPTTGIITISNVIENMLSITILNVLGQKVIENENPRSSTLTFDLSKYPPGVYYAQIIALNSATIRKIMLQ